MITGKTLIDWGIKPGSHMKGLLEDAKARYERMENLDAIRAAIVDRFNALPVRNRVKLNKDNPAEFNVFLDPETEAEWINHAAVVRDMRPLMQLPTVLRGAIMPDACPAGTIMVGGVVETKGTIHPGFHSADICCSMMATFFDPGVDPKRLLDTVHSVTHFGGGGRPRGKQWKPSQGLLDQFRENSFLERLMSDAIEHFGTQGDGNHFALVGRSRNTGQVALVTHHGSRRPGAMLYKMGMKAAREMTKEIAEGIPDALAWIPYDSETGRSYWQALQIIREWTKQSHQAIHRMAREAYDQNLEWRMADWLWNEHNFCFQRDDGKFLHAKGATPAWGAHSIDADPQGRVIIPMNMADGILIAKGLDRTAALGFAPHGAGRNVSRSQHMREAGSEWGKMELEELRKTLDVRFWFDEPDATELPSAYKNAKAVTAQMEAHGLVKVVDVIEPYGCIMAGNWVRRGKE